jgi:ABC-type dipeptide/oligopeptide/nickel transport system permease component
MGKNLDYIWSFPLVGGIFTLIGLFTPASSFSTNFTWIWGFIFTDVSTPIFAWSSLFFLVYLTPFVLLLVSVVFSIVLSILIRQNLIRQNGDFKRFRKLLFINAGLFIGGSVIYFFTSFLLIWPFWQFYRPGFAMIAPFISGLFLIFGTLFNERVLIKRSVPSSILKIKKFYRNILISLSLGAIFFLVGTFISFSLIYVLPGNKVMAYLIATGNPTPSPAEILAAEQLLGIHLHPFLRYIMFLCRTFTGNGEISVSITLGTPVTELLISRVPRMFEVIALPLVIVVGLGFMLGRFLAKKRGQWYTKLIQLVYMLGLAIPIFIIGAFCQYYLSFQLDIIPATYYKTVSLTGPTTRTGFLILDALLDGNFALAIDIFYHLLTPMIILCIVIFALVTWQTRSYMVNKHHKKSILQQTCISGITFGLLFMFYVLIDITFNLQGFGNLLINAANLMDYFVLIRCVFVIVITFVILFVISTILFSIYRFMKSVKTEPELEDKMIEKNENNETKAEGNIKEYITHEIKRQGKANTVFKIVLGCLGVGLMIFLIIVAIFPQLITQYTLQEASAIQAGAYNPPSPAHPLGQTTLGWDVLGLIMYGLGDSMFFGIIATLVGLVGGLPLGYLAGRFRKWINGPIMGVMLFFYMLPMFLILLLVYSIFGIYYVLSMVLVGILLIPNYTRAFSNVISGKITEDLKGIGKKSLSQVPLNMAIAVIIYNALSYVGFTNPSIPQNLGRLINSARPFLYAAPWATFWPGLAIFGIVATCILLYLAFQNYGTTLGTFKLKLRSSESIEVISE